jgi:hypothetical protein
MVASIKMQKSVSALRSKRVGFAAADPTSNGCAAAPHGGAIDRSAYDEETEGREEREEVAASAHTSGNRVTRHGPDSRPQFMNGFLRVPGEGGDYCPPGSTRPDS